MSDFKSKLDKAAQIHLDMMLLIAICKSDTGSLDLWGIYWESFLELSTGFPFKVKWDNPDTSYEGDIMQRYNAIDDFMKSIYSVRGQVK